MMILLGENLNYVMTMANSIIGVGVLAMPFCFQKIKVIVAYSTIFVAIVFEVMSGEKREVDGSFNVKEIFLWIPIIGETFLASVFRCKSQFKYIVTSIVANKQTNKLTASFCMIIFIQCGIVLSILVLLLSGAVSRLSCHFLLKASLMVRRRNFELLALEALGPTGKLSVELGIIGFLMGTVIAFFVVVGDLGPQIVAKALDVPPSDALRSWVLVLVSVVCVLPLGLLRNVDSLAAICTVTIGFYFCLVIKVVAESSPRLAASDWWDLVELWRPAGVLQCLPIFSMALFCQTQIFEIYDSMPNPSLEKMNFVVRWAVNICTGVYILVGSFGYIAFCHQKFSGNILLSLAPSTSSDAVTMGFVLSVAFSFPLAIFPCRTSLNSLLFRKDSMHHSGDQYPLISERRFRCLTMAIVSTGLLAGLLLPHIELVLGLVGATMGVGVCVLMPAACFIRVCRKESTERLLAQALVMVGVLTMVFGTYANLYALDAGTSGPVLIERAFQNPDSALILPELNVEKAINAFANPTEKLAKEKKVQALLASTSRPIIKVLEPNIISSDIVETPNQSKSVKVELLNNIGEINKDALKKEDQELALDDHVKDVKVTEKELVKIIDVNEKRDAKMIKKAIQDIKNQTNQLEKEFKEKIIEDIGLMAQLGQKGKVDKNEKQMNEVLKSAHDVENSVKIIKTDDLKKQKQPKIVLNEKTGSEIRDDGTNIAEKTNIEEGHIQNSGSKIPKQNANTDEKHNTLSEIKVSNTKMESKEGQELINKNVIVDSEIGSSVLKSKLLAPIALVMSNHSATRLKDDKTINKPVQNITKTLQRDILEVKAESEHDRIKRDADNAILEELSSRKIPDNKNCNKKLISEDSLIKLTDRLLDHPDIELNQLHTNEKDIISSLQTLQAHSLKPLSRDLKSLTIRDENSKEK